MCSVPHSYIRDFFFKFPHCLLLYCYRCLLARKLEATRRADTSLFEGPGQLPNTILHSRADSTVKKYLGAFRRWKRWAASYKLSPILARPHEFVLYLQYLGEETKSKSAVEEACNVLSWVHSCMGLITPSSHP